MTDNQWVIFGFVFQSCFMMRFLVQWIASEREGKSVIPISFWFFSLAGAAGLLTYAAVYLRDPVFAFGQSTGFIIYIRNLVLIRRTRLKEEAELKEKESPKPSPEEGEKRPE